MRARWTMVSLIALAISASLVTPAAAQDIRGLTLRATDKFATGTGGIVDLVKQPEGAGYLIKVDLSKAAEGLKGAEFKDAKAFVVWAVDMEGTRHNVGKLSDKGVLEDAKTSFVVAKLFVSPEGDANAVQPTGDRIYELTLRSVTETDKAPASSAKAAVAVAPATSSGSSSASASGSTGGTTSAGASTTAASASSNVSSTTTASSDKSNPQTLPTTGEPWQDLSVLAAVALLLLAGGWRLARARA